jgi:hypothetical protein
VGVAVLLLDGVGVDVGACPDVEAVPVGVGVDVGAWSLPELAVGVGDAVGATTTNPSIPGVRVGVGVAVEVPVDVAVAVALGVAVSVGVAEAVGVGVAVSPSTGSNVTPIAPTMTRSAKPAGVGVEVGVAVGVAVSGAVTAKTVKWPDDTAIVPAPRFGCGLPFSTGVHPDPLKYCTCAPGAPLNASTICTGVLKT